MLTSTSPHAITRASLDGTFFETLGFSFNPQFTDATATCMLVGEDAYFMLLTREEFTDFSKRPMGDSSTETNALFAISVNSRQEVDAMVEKAVAAGGSHAVDPQDHGSCTDRASTISMGTIGRCSGWTPVRSTADIAARLMRDENHARAMM